MRPRVERRGTGKKDQLMNEPEANNRQAFLKVRHPIPIGASSSATGSHAHDGVDGWRMSVHCSQNFWYAAALSSDVGEQPHGVTMFGKRFMVVRDDSGQPTVMNAACPHRGAPLDQGWVSTVQDRNCITCPYHGCAISSRHHLFEGATVRLAAAPRARREVPRNTVGPAERSRSYRPEIRRGIDTPSSLQGEYRADGSAHTSSRVAPTVGRHQPNTARRLHSLTCERMTRLCVPSLHTPARTASPWTLLRKARTWAAPEPTRRLLDLTHSVGVSHADLQVGVRLRERRAALGARQRQQRRAAAGGRRGAAALPHGVLPSPVPQLSRHACDACMHAR